MIIYYYFLIKINHKMLLNKTEQLVLKGFINNYYMGFSVENLAKSSNKSVPQIYRIIRKFSTYDFLVKTDNKYTIKLSNLFSQSYKRLVDAEKFHEIKETFRKRITQLKELLIEENKQKILSIVLFGSMADNSYNEKSDIDLLITHNSKKIEISTIHGHDFQFIIKKDDEFTFELNQFDDFIASIMKSHIVLYDPFNYFYLNMQAFQAKTIAGFSVPNNIILERQKQLKEIIGTLFFYIKRKNKKDAIEKFKQYILMSARLYLLEKGIVPTSKKNTFQLYQQLEKVDLYKVYNQANKKDIRRFVMKYVG